MSQHLSKSEMRIGGGVFVIFLVIAVIAGLGLTIASIYLNAAPSRTASMTGTLFINSSGQLHSNSTGPAYTATYNVTLAAVSGTGTMNLTLASSGTDILQQHEFEVTDFVVSPNNLTMTFSGTSVNLGWINNSTVLTSANGTYTGAWGPDAPASQTWGSIRPTDFPGVPAGYYVILSVTVPSQPVDTIPFFIGPVSYGDSSFRSSSYLSGSLSQLRGALDG